MASWPAVDGLFFECPPCKYCHISTTLELSAKKLTRWCRGEHIQDVFPELSPETREMMISGTHPRCFKAMFGEDDGES